MALVLFGQLLSVGDCWPEAVKLSKGEYVARVQARVWIKIFKIFIPPELVFVVFACGFLAFDGTRPRLSKIVQYARAVPQRETHTILAQKRLRLGY